MDNNTDLLYFNRHWNRFFNSCDITQLQNHYKLPTKKNEKKKIYLDKPLDYCLLYIDYAYNINTGNDYVMKLPAEIIDIVESYAHKFIKLVIKIDYKDGFPFYPPVWSLISVQHNLKNWSNPEALTEGDISDLEEYYEYICDIHNKVEFTYLLGIEGDIAEFISRIDYFDHVVEHCIM